MFSEHTLSEIRSRIDIVGLIGEFVELKKSGTSFVGLCPFHAEKTPSFHVHPLKQCYRCFGCNKGGNLFSFVCAFEGVSFPEAVKKLAAQAGVDVSHETYQKPKRQLPKSEEVRLEQMAQANEWAAKYFHYLLMEKAEYAKALDYLKNRGLTEKTIKKFQIGVSPSGWSTLRDLMLKRNYNAATLESAGLLIDKKNGRGGYDRFRDRLMFPIKDAEGRYIGFGARLLKDIADQPKYINSPESSLFSKRHQLYGLHRNQRDIRLKGEAIIVEGYMDVIGLYDKGVTNAVATMGTALTEYHCRNLRRLAQQVVTVFDPDEAGREAWRRSVSLFMAEGLFAKDLSLPEGTDPDEFIVQQGEQGAEKFYALCEKAPRQVTKLLKEIASEGALSEQARAKHLEALTPLLVSSRHAPDRALLWDSIGMVLKVSHQALRELAAGSRTRNTSKKPSPSRNFPRRTPQPESRPPIDAVDLEFCRWALLHPERFLELDRAEWEVALRTERLRTQLETLHPLTPSEFQESVQKWAQTESDERLLTLLSEALLPESSAPKPGNSEVEEEILRKIRSRRIELEIKSISTQIRLSSGDEEEQLRLLTRLKELRAEAGGSPQRR